MEAAVAAAVAAAAAKLVVVVVGSAVEGAAEACLGCVAAGSGSEVMWEVSDGVEALSCVLVRGSLFGWVGSEGRSWAGWRRRTEAGWVEMWHHWHYQVPWSFQGLQSLEQLRQSVVQGCWLREKAALTSGSATEEGTQKLEKKKSEK